MSLNSSKIARNDTDKGTKYYLFKFNSILISVKIGYMEVNRV